MAGLWAGVGILCGGGLIVLKPLAVLIYADQYTDHIFLMYWLVLAMGLYMIEVLPRSNIIARGSTKVVNRFIGAQVLATLVGSGLSIYLITTYGTLGIAQGMIVLFGLRSLISYGFFARRVW
jgi:O-antigen/teichoic acid export membrane protein